MGMIVDVQTNFIEPTPHARDGAAIKITLAVIIVVYGFFGSFGHGLSFLTVLVFGTLNFGALRASFHDRSTLMVYGCLSMVVYWTAFRSMGAPSWERWGFALSPMIPLALVGALLFVGRAMQITLSAQWLGRVASVSVLTVYVLGIGLNYVPLDSVFAPYGFARQGRLEMMSGNAIPFSSVLMVLTAFTLSGFRTNAMVERAVTLLCCCLGLYAAIVLSGTRGQVAALLVIAPVLLWHVSQSWRWAIFGLALSVGLFVAIVYAQAIGAIDVSIVKRTWLGLQTLWTGEKLSNSDTLRFAMWRANLGAIADAPIWGHGIAEQFNALRPHLERDFTFTHGHNDILNSTVAGGVIGGVTALAALCAPIVAWFICARRSTTAFYVGFVAGAVLLVNSSLNTVFFNDIMSSWLAFCTFLVVAVGRSERFNDQTDADQTG